MAGAARQHWQLAELMAARGMHHSSDLMPLLAQRGIELSRPQVYRIVYKQPARVSLPLLVALCDILGCRSDELLALMPDRGTLWVGSQAPAVPEPPSEIPDRGPARRRLLAAMAECIAELGYARTTVAHIVARARASRRTFYRHFNDREDCYIALLTQAHEDMIAVIASAVDPTAHWKVQARQAIEAWIARSESQPALTLSWIRDVPALGLAARRLQRNAMESFVAMLQTLSDTAELRAAGVGPVPRHRAVMIIGGLRELTALTAESGGDLGAITDDIVAACIALGPAP